MIIQRIHDDHRAGRNILHRVGNSAQQGFEERRKTLEDFTALWVAHGDMMGRAVIPQLEAGGGRADMLTTAGALQREVETLARELAIREAHDDEHWHTDFERMKQAYEQLCKVEEMEVMAALNDLPPELLAEASRLATVVRLG